MGVGKSQAIVVLICCAAFACGVQRASSEGAPTDPTPAAAPTTAAPAGTKTAVFAGGCFWGVEAVFEHVKGVVDARSGYAGGKARTARYDRVSEGSTGHAESVEVIFDPSAISYEQLLEIFFIVAHDPTQLDRQGPDVGPQYRSAIFYTDEEQKRAALAFIEGLTAAKKFPQPIVTEVAALAAFYPAEVYHQDYLRRHPNEPYIVYNDLPKLEYLKRQYPDLYSEN